MRKTPPPNMSRNNFPWSSSRKVQNEETLTPNSPKTEDTPHKKQSTLFNKGTNSHDNDNNNGGRGSRRKLQAIAVSKIRSVLTAFHLNRSSSSGNCPNAGGLGPKIVGTLFGYRKGHVHFVFQREHNSVPVFFIELATPITSLVREMASGLVRIALECDKQEKMINGRREKNGGRRLLEEPIWRTFCNGKICGFATRREIGANEAKILKAVEPISMGAGVLPGFNGSGSGPDGELMYMRAKFERVVGSRDSEAFYMMNPDCQGAPELSIYLLRV